MSFKVGDWVERLYDSFEDCEVGGIYKISSISGSSIYLEDRICGYDIRKFVIAQAVEETKTQLKNFYYSTSTGKYISYYYIQKNLYGVSNRQDGIYFQYDVSTLYKFENMKELIERLDNDMGLKYNTLQ